MLSFQMRVFNWFLWVGFIYLSVRCKENLCVVFWWIWAKSTERSLFILMDLGSHPQHAESLSGWSSFRSVQKTKLLGLYHMKWCRWVRDAAKAIAGSAKIEQTFCARLKNFEDRRTPTNAVVSCFWLFLNYSQKHYHRRQSVFELVSCCVNTDARCSSSKQK